jgi:hypothetical protein
MLRNYWDDKVIAGNNSSSSSNSPMEIEEIIVDKFLLSKMLEQFSVIASSIGESFPSK